MPSFGSANIAENRNTEFFQSFIDLKDLLQLQLQKFLSDISRKPVTFRCEALPAVAGDRTILMEVFSGLFAVMFADLPAGTNLYLHITCQAEKGSTPAREGGWGSYKIQFHTNLKATAEWKARALIQLNAINAAWRDHKWTLKLDDVRYAGRLFSVSLPGKLI